jgi:hypothetical protein
MKVKPQTAERFSVTFVVRFKIGGRIYEMGFYR